MLRLDVIVDSPCPLGDIVQPVVSSCDLLVHRLLLHLVEVAAFQEELGHLRSNKLAYELDALHEDSLLLRKDLLMHTIQGFSSEFLPQLSIGDPCVKMTRCHV